MKKRVLIVEDEELTARATAFAFEREGFETEIAGDGASAIEAVRERSPDVVILDVVLPGELTGFDVCRALRAESAVPIVFLSARAGETDRVLGLDRGGDDYVPKPFSMAELIGRVQALLRRVELDQRLESVRTIGGLTIDLARREVQVDGQRPTLTASEFKVLSILAERPGEPVTRDELTAGLWSSAFSGSTRTCDVHIRRLRAKIERDPQRPRRLLTVRSVGYKLVG